ncbi:MAG: glycosyltransferase family 4 protein [Phycisphaerales bacterium]|nr:MAG: glycosyltransferase family 4 protein [Phycisphaerales bacterium]
MSQDSQSGVAPRPKVAFVVHRYHPDIAGGAERHCRDVAQHMARHWDVTVLTSCAQDYRTWANAYPAGESQDEAVRLIRFPTSVERDYPAFDRLSVPVLAGEAGAEMEARWIEAQGPVMPSLAEYLRAERDNCDAFVFFTYLYWSTVRGIVEVGNKAWLVPTAHDEKPIRLAVYDRVFAAPRVIVYNTAAERRFCAGRFARRAPMEEIVGCGVDAVAVGHIDRLMGFRPPDGRPLAPGYLLYVGRVDLAKNVAELLDQYVAMVQKDASWPELVLVGPVSMDVQKHPKIRVIGYVEEDIKHALMQGASVLIQPSVFESLSLVLLESWLCETPVMVNGRCEVLREQAVAAGGGLYYETAHQMREGLTVMLSKPRLRKQMAAAGRAFTEANYSWPAIEGKYLNIWERYKGTKAGAPR